MPRFDSDTDALVQRAALNASRGARDLEEWIFERIQLAAGMRILDLGCGTGKQIFALSERLSELDITGVDISQDAVDGVNRRARAAGLTGVRAVRASLDDCPAALPAGRYDIVLSSYAIYYARDVVGLMRQLSSVLTPSGTVFVCGPGRGTNDEMRDLMESERAAHDDPVPRVEDFLGEDALERLRGHYREVEVTRMTNPVGFRSADEVLSWWRHHNSHSKSLDAGVAARLARWFAAEPEFRLTKNVLGVGCRV